MYCLDLISININMPIFNPISYNLSIIYDLPHQIITLAPFTYLIMHPIFSIIANKFI